MSETFYIKKTAFDDNNFNLTTREDDSFIIGPGELNGPAGLARDSDLELYGFGSLKWGEGVDQNQYRLMESSACPAKVDGDYYNGIILFDVATHGIVPKSEEDLGIGNGITAPLIGQLWYNTSDNILYNYELTWQTVFQEVTDALTIHEDRTDLHLGSPQNIFLDGLTLTGSPALISDDVNQLIGIRYNDGTVQDQIDLMVDTRGDNMTGPLSVDMGALLTPGITIEANLSPAINLKSTTTSSGFQEIRFIDAGDATRGRLQVSESGGEFAIDIWSAGGVPQARLVLEADGNLSLIGGANIPTEIDHLTRRDFITTNYAPLVSPTLTGIPKSSPPSAADNSTRIATTAFVKASLPTSLPAPFVFPRSHGTGTRVMNSNYTNTHGYQMFLSVKSRNHNNFRGSLRCTISLSGYTSVNVDFTTYTGNADISPGGFWVIPIGATYNVSITDTTADTYTQWIEYY